MTRVLFCSWQAIIMSHSESFNSSTAIITVFLLQISSQLSLPNQLQKTSSCCSLLFPFTLTSSFPAKLYQQNTSLWGISITNQNEEKAALRCLNCGKGNLLMPRRTRPYKRDVIYERQEILIMIILDLPCTWLDWFMVTCLWQNILLKEEKAQRK